MAPSDGEVVTTSDVNVSWSGTDGNGIAYYLVRLDDGEWINVGTTSYYVFIGVPNGVHVAYVIAVDVAGHRTLSSIMFVVDAVSASSSSLPIVENAPVVSSSTVRPVVYSGLSINDVKYEDIDSAGEEASITSVDERDEKVEYVLSIKVNTEEDSSKPNIVAISFSKIRENKDLYLVAPLTVHGKEEAICKINFVVDGSSAIIKTLFLMYSIYLVRPPN